MTAREKILISVCAFIIIGTIGYIIIQGVQYSHLNKEIKRLNEKAIEDIRNAKKAKQIEVNAYMDTLQIERKRADSLRVLQVESGERIDELIDKINDIQIPTTVDGRVDELNRIGSELRN